MPSLAPKNGRPGAASKKTASASARNNKRLASTAKKTPTDASSLDQAIARLRDGDTSGLPLAEVITLTEHVMGSLQEVFSVLDATILREFSAIAQSISRAKQDIGRLQPGEISGKRIPEAGIELAAVIESTENATHQIMEAAERMMAIEAEDIGAYRKLIEAEAMSIFEACSFQDITGQRVSKVVEALQDIDERVSQIAATLGFDDVVGELSEREAAREARKKDLILHGPALDGEGTDQNSIDAMFD